MQIERTRTVGYNTTVFYMTNGQVWRQTDNTHVQLSRRRGVTEYTATISNGALGSHFMRLDNGGRRFRAERVE